MQSLVSSAAMNILLSRVHSPPHICSKGQDYNLNNSAWKNISKRMPRANDISMQRTYLINGACEQSDALVPIEALIKRLNNGIANYKLHGMLHGGWVPIFSILFAHMTTTQKSRGILIMTDFTVPYNNSINTFLCIISAEVPQKSG